MITLAVLEIQLGVLDNGYVLYHLPLSQSKYEMGNGLEIAILGEITKSVCRISIMTLKINVVELELWNSESK